MATYAATGARRGQGSVALPSRDRYDDGGDDDDDDATTHYDNSPLLGGPQHGPRLTQLLPELGRREVGEGRLLAGALQRVLALLQLRRGSQPVVHFEPVPGTDRKRRKDEG
jgi:hypothetical protein